MQPIDYCFAGAGAGFAATGEPDLEAFFAVVFLAVVFFTRFLWTFLPVFAAGADV